MPDDPHPTDVRGTAVDERPPPTVGHDRGPRRAEATPPRPSRMAGAIAGFVAAAAALAAGELAVGTVGDGSTPSLVSAVGSEFIDRFAASLKDLAVSLFGQNDKVALVVGIVVVSLLFGVVLGIEATRRLSVGIAGFVAFGALGLWAYLRDPLGDTATGVIASAAAVAVGVATLVVLLRIAASEPTTAVDDRALEAVDGVLVDGRVVAAPRSPVDMRYTARRTFLIAAGLITAGAAGAAALGRRLAGDGASESARATVRLPAPDRTGPVATTDGAVSTTPGISPYVTPNDDFYRIDTALTIPQVDLASWRLKVDGMVDRPFELSHDDLLALDSVEETVTLSCVSNEVGGDLVGNAVWQGVPLAALLERAGVQRGADQVVGRSIDEFTAGFPTELATDGRTALVAYAMNGEPLPVDHGFPARLVVAGLYGYVSATKWLSNITLTTWDGFDGYWMDKGWSKEGPIKTQSRIDVPRGGQEIDEGSTPVAGVAWAPSRGIERVEIRIDDGPWTRCAIAEPASENTWVQWRADWDATPGEHTITVRATDGEGDTQTSEITRPDPNGASGWHSRTVNVRG